MGGAHSRELELAQQQVSKLTTQLNAVNSKLRTGHNNLAAVAVHEAELKATKEALTTTELELQASSSQLQSMRAQVQETRTLEREVIDAKEEARLAKIAAREQKGSLSTVVAELTASKKELERVFGELKFAQQEGLALAGIRDDLSEAQRELAQQQKEAAEMSAQLLADASAEALRATGGDTAAHPVYGELLCDLGHKRLYKGDPATLWVGTTLWEKQRAFRQERAKLIAASKERSKVYGWPGSIAVIDGGGGGGGGGPSAGVGVGMLIDGQHRLGAAHLLSQKGALPPGLESMVVEVRNRRAA
jgi:DNA repair exonuclease SbcCD ATPase subunit